ncbi:hypothetical protein, partial [Streptomyces spinoverrucosus]|uniref:hypothetical protein n=1 Tax=Streptomyces spinoverrucosus TaxID=284043 RepID=UPI001C3F8AD2
QAAAPEGGHKTFHHGFGSVGAMSGLTLGARLRTRVFQQPDFTVVVHRGVINRLKREGGFLVAAEADYLPAGRGCGTGFAVGEVLSGSANFPAVNVRLREGLCAHQPLLCR